MGGRTTNRRCGAARTGSLRPIARPRVIQGSELGLEAIEFVARHFAFPIEGTQFGSPPRDLTA